MEAKSTTDWLANTVATEGCTYTVRQHDVVTLIAVVAISCIVISAPPMDFTAYTSVYGDEAIIL